MLPVTLGTVLNTITVPVVVANTGVATNMGLTGSVNGVDYGTMTGQTNVALTPAGAGHPTGAGLTAGTIPTATSSESMAWAKPAATALTTATLTADPSRATVFSYEPGTAMVTGVASARRVGFLATTGTGNTTGQTAQLFDAAVAWETGSTPIITYVRDATDRIVARKINGTTTVKYSYTATGDTTDITLDAAGNIIEATTVLTGGVLWTSRPGGTDVWSYPNIHGDLVATANSLGVKQGPTRVYDPYGVPLGGSTIPDNSAGAFDYGWHGSQQRPLENQAGLTPVIEMGARQYSPTLGRFLEVDPIEGGVDNNYTYVLDPVNNSDLNGMWCVFGKYKGIRGGCRGGSVRISANVCPTFGCIEASFHKRRLSFSGGIGVAVSTPAVGARLDSSDRAKRCWSKSAMWFVSAGPVTTGREHYYRSRWVGGLQKGWGSPKVGAGWVHSWTWNQ